MVAIVSHDAGGAEILSSWILRQAEPVCLVLDGPAKNIFQRKLGNIENVLLEEAITKCDWMLCGTSWQSNLERMAITQCKSVNKKVVAFLDHWVNYLERFDEAGVVNLPDEIWVSDKYAESIARPLFPMLPVVLKSNPYFDDLIQELNIPELVPGGLEFKAKQTILYVCEPIREHALLQFGDELYWGYTEEDALRFFLSNVNVFNTQINQIIVRPHPSEAKNKYDWAIEFSEHNIKIGGDLSLFEEIAISDIVVGCSSMAMIIGLLAQRRVVSSIPPNGAECSLPHAEIEYMRSLIEKKKLLNA